MIRTADAERNRRLSGAGNGDAALKSMSRASRARKKIVEPTKNTRHVFRGAHITIARNPLTPSVSSQASFRNAISQETATNAN